MSSNITHQSGNLTDKPTIDKVGNREFVRARLAQSWQYDTQGKTVTHRQFLPLVFFGRSAQSARHFETDDEPPVHQNEIRRALSPYQPPAFIQESIHDWPL